MQNQGWTQQRRDNCREQVDPENPLKWINCYRHPGTIDKMRVFCHFCKDDFTWTRNGRQHHALNCEKFKNIDVPKRGRPPTTKETKLEKHRIAN